MTRPINVEAANLVVSAKRMENGSVQISFDCGSSASAFWLSQDEALELIDELLDSISAKRIKRAPASPTP